MGKNIGKNISKNLNCKFKIVRNVLIMLIYTAADALKIASKRVIEKAIGATSDLIENKIADKDAWTSSRKNR